MPIIYRWQILKKNILSQKSQNYYTVMLHEICLKTIQMIPALRHECFEDNFNGSSSETRIFLRQIEWFEL